MTDDLLTYKTLPIWTHNTIPTIFRRGHNTQPGVWAQLDILKGNLELAITHEDGRTEQTLTLHAGQNAPFIPPRHGHYIQKASDDMRCQMRFLCTAEDYTVKKYGLIPPHSELVTALSDLRIPARARTLDVGCCHGRNALYLALKGYTVDALDISTEALMAVQTAAQAEGWQQRVHVQLCDLNRAAQGQVVLEGSYDLVLCTVVLMFVQRAAVRPIIEQMQAATVPGGRNLIVCAMDTPDAPCTQPFAFTFAPGELSDLYRQAGWELCKYNEDFGHLHQLNEHGEPISMRFATLVARKP